MRDAACFYIEQTMLSRGSDSYRVLGSTHGAPQHELRRNMILLLKWLHPDSRRQSDRSVFAQRVLSAWSDLKTPARRAAYDAAQQLRSKNGSASIANGDHSRHGGRRPVEARSPWLQAAGAPAVFKRRLAHFSSRKPPSPSAPVPFRDGKNVKPRTQPRERCPLALIPRHGEGFSFDPSRSNTEAFSLHIIGICRINSAWGNFKQKPHRLSCGLGSGNFNPLRPDAPGPAHSRGTKLSRNTGHVTCTNKC